MPYNIDNWITKKIEDLRIPLKAFFPESNQMWWPEKEWTDDGTLILRFMDAAEICGDEIDRVIHVKKIEFYGEGSGTSMHEIFEPALKESSGRLVASLVWEGGDSINRIIVNDGLVEWEDIEI